MKISSEWIKAFALGAFCGFALAALVIKSNSSRDAGPAMQSPAIGASTASAGPPRRATTDIPPSGIQSNPFIPAAAGPRRAAAPPQGSKEVAAATKLPAGNGGYDFDAMTRSPEADLRRRFDGEAEDAGWAPGTQDTLRVFLDSLPERSAASSVDIECHSSLCIMSIAGDMNVLAPATEKNNLQVDLSKFLASSPGSDLFDNQMVMLGPDPRTGEVTLTVFLHRRQQSADGRTKS